VKLNYTVAPSSVDIWKLLAAEDIAECHDLNIIDVNGSQK